MVADTVHYLVMEEGAWEIDGVRCEAQRYTSTVTDENNAWNGERQAYLQAYDQPVVLGQVMSENDPRWSVFWCCGNRRQNPPSRTVLTTGKTVCEDPDATRAAETVGFIVFEEGHGSIGGIPFEARLGPDSVAGTGNAPPYTYGYLAPFVAAPAVHLATVAGMDGGDGGWAYTYHEATTPAGINLAIDEDQTANNERNHTSEQVGYVVFAAPPVIP
ncbi:MAG TPA: hypothetical protein P5572_05615 [Phycisphaerae bacterium]|nr:hypothetical protein [Phycisphaerae bacterium]